MTENDFELAAFQSATLYTRYNIYPLLKKIYSDIDFKIVYNVSYYQYFNQSCLPTCWITFIHPITRKNMTISVSSYMCGFVKKPYMLIIDQLLGSWCYRKDFNNLIEINDFITENFSKILNLSERIIQLSLFDF